MPDRSAIAVAAWLIGVSAAAAQPPAGGDAPLPPLLPVPTGPGTPAPCCPPGGPVDEAGRPLAYDRSLLYIPDRHPGPSRAFESRPRDERAFWGRAAAIVGQTQSIDAAAVLAGAPDLRPNWRAGVDAAAGIWWDSERSRGAEAGAMYLAEGTATAGTTSVATRFFTANGNYRQTVGKVWKVKLDVFAGYRFAAIGEDLNAFHTSNHFHGGTVGLGGEYRSGPWSTDIRATVALGKSFSERTGNAVPRNDSTFAAMPELAMSLGREVLDGGRLFVGYRFAAVNKVLRPTTSRGEWNGFWTQGVMLGLDWWF